MTRKDVGEAEGRGPAAAVARAAIGAIDPLTAPDALVVRSGIGIVEIQEAVSIERPADSAMGTSQLLEIKSS